MLTFITQRLTTYNRIAFRTKPEWFIGAVRMIRFNGQCGASLDHNSTTYIVKDRRIESLCFEDGRDGQ